MSDINRNGTANMPFSTLNYPTLLAQSRTLMTAPSGGAVRGVIQRLHELMKAVPDANEMMMTSILYESYSLLRSDACAALVSGVENEKLNIAIHASEVLEELRDGTACVVPTGENCELSIVPVELHHRWWEGPGSEEDAEGLVFETLETVMHQAKNFPLAMEVTQSLVTYTLAVALESLPREDYPRQETARTIKLAKYAVPWARYHSVGYICCLREEVFLLDGDIDEGSSEDYLNAIHQAEKVVPHEDLKRYLMDRTAAPCFDFELEEAVKLWLGDEYKQWGRPVEPSDVRESFDD